LNRTCIIAESSVGVLRRKLSKQKTKFFQENIPRYDWGGLGHSGYASAAFTHKKQTVGYGKTAKTRKHSRQQPLYPSGITRCKPGNFHFLSFLGISLPIHFWELPANSVFHWRD